MKKEAFSILFLALAALVWFAMVFSGFKVVAGSDWDMVLSYHQLQKATILGYHQFPLWNPYLSGGEPWLAHPVSDFLSPFFVFILLFGNIQGTIIAYFFGAALGLLGVYFLSRHYSLGRWHSVIVAILCLNIFNRIAYTGTFTFLGISLVPWVFLLFQIGKEKKSYLVYAAVLSGFIILASYVYIFVMLFILLLIDGSFYAARKKDPKFIKTLFSLSPLPLLLSAPRLLPMLDLLREYPRIKAFNASGPFFDLGKFLPAAGSLKELFLPGTHGVFTFMIVPASVFICAVLWKKYKALITAGLVFFALSLGNSSPVDLWRVLHSFLPSIGGYGKFAAVAILVFSLCVGLAMLELREKPVYKGALAVFSFVLILNVFFYSRGIFKERPEIAYRLDAGPSPFAQVEADPRKTFEVIYAGHGALSRDAGIYFDTIGGQIPRSVSTMQDAGYKGEYYLNASSGKIESVSFSPNRISVRLKLFADDKLVINQNYFPGWRSSVGRVRPFKGLLSIDVDKTTADLVLYYLPVPFIAGCGLFLVGLFAASLAASRFRRSERPA